MARPTTSTEQLTIRPLEERDLPFLREMLYAALFWNPAGERYPFDVTMEHPQVRIYHESWGRAGDAGLVAEDAGQPVGAVWYRLFTEEEHGEGYVDEETPELAIAVVESHRGRGIGRALMDAMAELARGAGLARIALSVESENPAKRLYARLGYVDYEPGDGLGRMILDL